VEQKSKTNGRLCQEYALSSHNLHIFKCEDLPRSWRGTFKIATTVITDHHVILVENKDTQKTAKNINDTLIYDENCRRKSKAMATIGREMVQVKIVINVKITEYTKRKLF
jgi:hypothetical protein